MAQQLFRKYTGAFEAEALTEYSGALFPANTIMQMKTHDVKASVNGSVMFPVSYDDESIIDPTFTYKFNKKCVVALQVEVTSI